MASNYYHKDLQMFDRVLNRRVAVFTFFMFWIVIFSIHRKTETYKSKKYEWRKGNFIQNIFVTEKTQYSKFKNDPDVPWRGDIKNLFYSDFSYVT